MDACKRDQGEVPQDIHLCARKPEQREQGSEVVIIGLPCISAVLGDADPVRVTEGSMLFFQLCKYLVGRQETFCKEPRHQFRTHSMPVDDFEDLLDQGAALLCIRVKTGDQPEKILAVLDFSEFKPGMV